MRLFSTDIRVAPKAGTYERNAVWGTDGTLKASKQISKSFEFMQGGGANEWSLIAYLPATTGGTMDTVTINVAAGEWTAMKRFATFTFERRAGFRYRYISPRGLLSKTSIQCYQEASGAVSIWAYLPKGSPTNYTVMSVEGTAAYITNWGSTSQAGTPTGDLIFDSNTATRTQTDGHTHDVTDMPALPTLVRAPTQIVDYTPPEFVVQRHLLLASVGGSNFGILRFQVMGSAVDGVGNEYSQFYIEGDATGSTDVNSCCRIHTSKTMNVLTTPTHGVQVWLDGATVQVYLVVSMGLRIRASVRVWLERPGASAIEYLTIGNTWINRYGSEDYNASSYPDTLAFDSTYGNWSADNNKHSVYDSYARYATVFTDSLEVGNVFLSTQSVSPSTTMTAGVNLIGSSGSRRLPSSPTIGLCVEAYLVGPVNAYIEALGNHVIRYLGGASTKTYQMSLYERVQLIYIGNNVWSLR